MKRKITFLSAAFMLLTFLVVPLGMRGQTRESYNVTYSYNNLGDMLSGSYLDATSYWKVPETAGNTATISIPITYQPDSDITLTFRIATFGSGTNPSSSNTTITAVGTESNSNWSGSGVSSYPSSSTYVNGVMTITKPQDPTTLGGLIVTMGVNTGVKIFRLQSITVAYSYSGSQLTPSDLALVDAPVELEFDLYDNADAQTVSYTTSSTGEVTVSQSNYITATVNANNTITVTPVAVTNGPQTITVNQASDGTYEAGSVTFTVDIEDSTPSTGTDVTFDATVDKDLNNTSQGEGSIVKNGVTFACDNGILGNGTEYRLYKNSTTTFSVTSGTITQIVFTCPSSNPASGFATQAGWTTNGDNGTWTGSATSVSFVASSKQVRATTIVVTVEGGDTPDPTISASNVNIAYDATNGSIAYTINNEPSPAGTLTAAVTDGNWLTLGQGTTSPIAFTCSANENTTARTATVTLTYTYNTDQTVSANVTVTQAAAPLIYSTIPDLFAAATSTETNVLVTFNNWVVSGVSTNGKNVFVTDNNGNGFVIFDNNGGLGNTYTAGDILAGTAVSCNLKKYNGFAELLNVDASSLTITTGGTVTVANVAMADLAGVNTGALVHYDNLTCSVNNNKYYLSDGTTTLQVYNALYAFEALDASKTYNITGVYQQYNNTKEVLPRSAADIEEVTAPVVPSITVDPDEINVDGVSQDGYLTIDYDNLDIQSAEDFTIQFYDDNNQTIEKPNWMLEANVTTQVGEEGYFVYYMVGTNEDQIRTAHFKVKVSDTYSNLVTLTQAKVVPFINLLAVNDGDDSYLINYTSEASGGYPDKIQHGYFSATSGANSFHIQYCDNNGTAIDVTPEWIEQVTVVDAPSWISSTYALYVSVFANEGSARSAYFKVWALDNDSNPVYSELVTLNQAAVDYATLPFEFDGGRADIATTAGLTQEGLESDYASAPKLKFNGTGDYVLLKINERPGTLTFDIKGYTFSGGTFTVQTSEDGTTFTDLKNYTDANFGNTLQSEEFNNLGENVRYIKWIYTEKSNGNVALGNIKLAKYVEPVVVASITVDPALVDAPAEGVEGTLTVTYENITTVVAEVWFCNAAGTTEATYNWITADINAQNNVEYLVESNNGEARTAYLKVYALDDNGDDVYSNLVTVTQAAAPAMALYTYSINGVEGQTIVAEVGATITLDNGENLNDDFIFAGWTTDANDVSLRFTGEYTLSDDVTVFYAVYKREGSVSIINTNTENFPTTYGQANIFNKYTLNGKQFMIRQAYINNNTHVLQFRAAGNNNGTGTLYNSESLGTINSIVLDYNSEDTKKNFTVFAGTNANPTDGVQIEPTINDNTYTFDLSGGNYSYFVMTNGVNAGYLNSITINATNCSAKYYTRVFLENPTTPVVIAGPSIVPSGYTLDASSVGLYNSLDASKLIIEDGAQLKTPNAVFATVEKNITGYGEANFQTNQGYYLVSAPAATYLYVDSNNGNVDAYMFDASEQGEEWRNFKLAGGAWHIAAGNAVLYASKNDCTLSLDGYGIVYNTPNPGANIVNNKVPATNANIEIDVQFNGGKTFEGFNLIGNPFTCTAYLADGTKDFYRMNSTGDAIVLAATTERAIGVCEGIFVVTTSGEYKVAFTTTEPATSTSGNSNAMLNLSITQNRGSLVDNARIRFGEGNAMPKMVFGDNSRIFFTQGTKDYAVVRSNAEGEMPVSFKAENNGSYTISVNAENVEMNYLHLIDNLTGADIDLLVNPSYSFEAKTTDYASRFRLVFNANTVNENSNETFAYYNGSEWVINNMGEATLQVVDVMGRMLSTETVSGNATMNTNSLSAGIYMMRLVKGEDVKVQKIVVR